MSLHTLPTPDMRPVTRAEAEDQCWRIRRVGASLSAISSLLLHDMTPDRAGQSAEVRREDLAMLLDLLSETVSEALPPVERAACHATSQQANP